MRGDGYYIANVLAGGRGASLPLEIGQRRELHHILLERFLIQHDDGWVFRRSRTYRGSVQVEDESAAAQTLLYRLTQLPSLPNQDLLLLRQAFTLLPGSQDSPQASVVRQLSTVLAERDPGFEPIRAKIHGQPTADDASRVRQYLTRVAPHLQSEYEALAVAIDELFADPQVDKRLLELAEVVRTSALRQELRDAASLFRHEPHADVRFLTAGSLLAALRQYFPSETNSQVRLDMLATGLVLEQEMLRAGNVLLKYNRQISRKSQLGWLSGANDALYGTGLISARQWMAVSRAIDRLVSGGANIKDYRSKLNYLSRAPGWGSRWLAFHFEKDIQHLSNIEPKAANFIPDRLRGSIMLIYNSILDALIMDADRLAGVRSSLFGETKGTGLRALNAGIARGTLHFGLPQTGDVDSNGIYVLPETTADLPPVAGILTSGEGNALSHVQLLASNLGIPNVVIDDQVVAQLKRYEGHRIVMAVSAGGVVEITSDNAKWNSVLPQQGNLAPGSRLSPDYAKLDLMQTSFIDLREIRAKDSGVVSGPKAANLGELKYHFPDAVTDGLVIPFGIFNEFLQNPSPISGQTGKDWLSRQYGYLASLPHDQQAEATSQILTRIREWILNTDPGPEFRQNLQKTVTRVFGPEGRYSLFVRSDTNVEDLPGFTGAGLNLTVPNVRTFDELLTAILQVWASPFEERAFAWRQKRMDKPEWVFPSILLLRSVEVDKSGVMLTANPATGDRDELTVAINQGIGGAVSGGAAEELRLNRKTGEVTVLADATRPYFKGLGHRGGLVKMTRTADGDILEVNEMQALINLSVQVEDRLPEYSSHSESGIADVEFGFRNGKLVLFQIRPFVQAKSAGIQRYLLNMDKTASKRTEQVDLRSAPAF